MVIKDFSENPISEKSIPVPRLPETNGDFPPPLLQDIPGVAAIPAGLVDLVGFQ